MFDRTGEDVSRRTDGAARMSLRHAFGVLGLSPSATAHQVRAAYRRLAFIHHPDRHRDGTAGLAEFQRITAAYRLLLTRLRLRADDSAGECVRCGRYSSLRRGLDNNRYCLACLMRLGAGRLLPAPPVVVVTCGSAIAALAIALGCLIAFLMTGSFAYTVAALIAGSAGLIALAFTAVSVAYTVSPPRTLRRRPRKRDAYGWN